MILIANPGSTSYKCKLLSMPSGEILFQAAVERIGESNSKLRYQFQNGEEIDLESDIPDYISAIKKTIDALEEKFQISQIAAVGFKAVLAKGYSGCYELTDDVISAMREYLPLAPVHNAAYLTAIETIKKVMPEKPLIGLFETSFHKKIPPEAYLYGIPYEFFEKYGIRKYGFHGASHSFVTQYVADKYAKDLQNPKIISCHLGGSSSVCAIKNGVSVDTSMGMSPQSGLINANRVGDFDAFALLYLMEKEKFSIDQIREILITNSGVKGISGFSGDLRDIENAMLAGNRRAKIAFDTFAYYVKRYIGEYLAILNGVDFIAFTGGIGQNSSQTRQKILQNMENLGIILDEKKNAEVKQEGIISTDESDVTVLVVPTNEELVVARAVYEFLQN